MLVRKRILRAGVSEIELIENIIASEQRKNDFIITFEQLRETGIIIASSFEDVEWKYKSEVYNTPFPLTFDLRLYSNFNDLLRAYTVVRIISRIAPSTIALEIRYLKRVIIITKGFQDLDELHTLCINLSAPETSRITRTITRFVDFIDLPNKDEVIYQCERYSYHSHNNRELPDFTHVMNYDKCIDDYFTQHDIKDTQKFLPVILWWRLTTILPMRPSELMLLSYNCIEVSEPFNEYWIHIPRIKERKKNRIDIKINETLEYQKIQIDKATYQFIKQFQLKLALITDNEHSEYLLPYSLYQKSLKTKSKSNYIRMDLHSFKVQLKRFYEEVIVGYYGHKNCVRIKPGDTRHFAIINMFLQGYNPLSIARMAGHESILTQENYYNHAIHFAESHIYHIAKQKFESRTTQRLAYNTFGNTRDVYDRGLQYTYDELQHYRKVEFGYCNDLTPQFPENCSNNCFCCTHYIFKPALNEQEEGIKRLTEYSNELRKRITTEIENIFNIGKKVNELNKIRIDEALKNKSRILSQQMDEKILVDSIRLEVD